MISTFFLRIAARCNLNCDYCYVFKHRDMSWKNSPATMTDENVLKFSQRIDEYVRTNELKEINVIFHGGEPMIVGADRLLSFVDIIKKNMTNQVKINFSLQTNGTLLTEELLDEFEKRDIGVSLSIDGPQKAHDKHRKYLDGKGSFDDVLNAAKMLNKHPNIFEGIIGVIDPANSPEELLSFFSDNELLNIDLLLPDSTYLDKPIGRDEQPDIYINWLKKCFELWFTKYQNLHFRTFEFILSALLGEKAESDTFGLGKLDYLTIETDGAYHTSDILKITYENASNMHMNLTENTINEALNNEMIAEYNELLSYNKLPQKCKDCKCVSICGGGSLPHRYSPENGFDNPTIYCNEMFELIEYAQQMLEKAVLNEC